MSILSPPSSFPDQLYSPVGQICAQTKHSSILGKRAKNESKHLLNHYPFQLVINIENQFDTSRKIYIFYAILTLINAAV